MKARFIHLGNAIDHTPGSDVAAGDVVVQGELVGIARLDIPAETLGALAVTGVCDLPKATGSDTAIDAGAKVYWDAGNGVVTTDDNSGANKHLGKTIAAAGDNDERVRVRLTQ